MIFSTRLTARLSDTNSFISPRTETLTCLQYYFAQLSHLKSHNVFISLHGYNGVVASKNVSVGSVHLWSVKTKQSFVPNKKGNRSSCSPLIRFSNLLENKRSHFPPTARKKNFRLRRFQQFTTGREAGSADASPSGS